MVVEKYEYFTLLEIIMIIPKSLKIWQRLRPKCLFKVVLSPSKQVDFIYFNKSHLKMIKKGFRLSQIKRLSVVTNCLKLESVPLSITSRSHQNTSLIQETFLDCLAFLMFF